MPARDSARKSLATDETRIEHGRKGRRQAPVFLSVFDPCSIRGSIWLRSYSDRGADVVKAVRAAEGWQDAPPFIGGLPARAPRGAGAGLVGLPGKPALISRFPLASNERVDVFVCFVVLSWPRSPPPKLNSAKRLNQKPIAIQGVSRISDHAAAFAALRIIRSRRSRSVISSN